MANEAAKTLRSSIPTTVAVELRSAIAFLNQAQTSLEHGRSTDRQFQGNGRYEADTVLNLFGSAASLLQRKEESLQAIAKWRQFVADRGIEIDFDALLQEFGGVPQEKTIYLTKEALEWLS